MNFIVRFWKKANNDKAACQESTGFLKVETGRLNYWSIDAFYTSGSTMIAMWLMSKTGLPQRHGVKQLEMSHKTLLSPRTSHLPVWSPDCMSFNCRKMS